jgi:intein/homing endonuclease
MISYQFTWKYEMGVELHQIREYLDTANRSRLEEDVDNASAWLERFLMISAFTIRRLGESGHLGIDLNKRLLRALSIRKRKGVLKSGLSDLQKFSTNYQTDRPKTVRVPARRICNLLIHSCILLDCEEEKGRVLSGFIVSSDKTHEKQVFYIENEEYFAFVEEVVIDGSDGYVYNKNTGFVDESDKQ